MTYKLLPCPFCGGTPILELFNDGFFDYARIRCCRVMFDWCRDETGEQAIAAWNRRVDARQLALKTNEQLKEQINTAKIGWNTYKTYSEQLEQQIAESNKIIKTQRQENEQLKADCDRMLGEIQELTMECNHFKERLQISPYGDDKIDELDEALENCKFQYEQLKQENERLRAQVARRG